jgi:hypothetical protein
MVLRSSIAFVAALCACGASAIHADVSESFEVTIRLRVDRSLTSRRITDRLKTETGAIWEPYGVRLEWTGADVSESPANGVSLDATVQRHFERRQRTEWPAVLGLAFVTPDAPTWQPIRVSFDATERLLTDRTTGRVSGAGLVLDRALARALGRVLAHEIGHILLGAPSHDPAGLMRASFRGDELGEPDRTPFRLTCSGVDRLRGRLRALRGDPQPVHQHNSTTLDLEGVRGTRSESSVGASCISG